MGRKIWGQPKAVRDGSVAGDAFAQRTMRFLASPRGQVLSGAPVGGVIRAAGLESGSRVLDAGCRRGDLLVRLHRRVGFVSPIHGVDSSEDVVAEGRELIEEMGLAGRIALQAAPASELPFGEGSFDVVLSPYLARHLSDDDLLAAFGEARRVLRSGGTLAAWEFRSSSLSGINLQWTRFLSAGGTTTVRLRSYREIEAIALEAGFSLARRVRVGPFLYPFIPRVFLVAQR